MKSIDTYIEYLLKHKKFLTEEQLGKLNQLVENIGEGGTFEKFEVTELDHLYQLVRVLQNKILTSDGELLANSTARDIASLTGSISSLLRGFAAHQQKINEAEEMAILKQAVLDCILPLPQDARDRFFKALDSKS